MTRLALFDLDHTLLHGDTDVLWCDFLIDAGVLERQGFERRNADMQARYQAGEVDAAAFTQFYLGTLAGRSAAQWEPLRRRFLAEVVVPRIPRDALALVGGHLAAGDLVVMTTATNRFLTEPTAAHFGIPHLLATEPEVVGGVLTGLAIGTLNMREGKVARLHDFLAARGLALDRVHSTAYSDSINDLPLLEAVSVAVAVDADARLSAIARQRGWRSLSLR